MVRDGFYYGFAFIAVAIVLGLWLSPWVAIVPLLLAFFFLWFFRDPERRIPADPGLVVSCADGVVTDIAALGSDRVRISIFLNVFNVHVNRSPVAGVITNLDYRKGAFKNAMGSATADLNEQNICPVRTDEGYDVVFKQIAGLLARRIVFSRKVGDRVNRGERVGLIKFGSRCDVILPATAQLAIKVGQKVSGGSTVLAALSGANVSSTNGAVVEAQR